ncbi:ROK family protein [Marinivivus vitaminiproducens]|uniref:ROK family protein n=1 Tax=Marinivivus vitaminiproducens TaxID=3035935 RepID=UPI0027A0DB47|nr:ROK family transcriptional regulator [Geminicoccaceae bacterium SCSIO 64248]
MKTADPELMRAINRFHVLDTIRRAGSIARVEIGVRTDLSSATVSAITAALIDDRLIAPRHVGGIRGASRGRPRVLLELNPGAARVVGIVMTPGQMVTTLTDFRGDVLAERAVAGATRPEPLAAVVERLADGVLQCLGGAALELSDLTAVAVALPGIVERGRGRVRSSCVLGDRDVMLADALADRLGVPVIVEGDANAMTMAHHWFGDARDLDDVLLVLVDREIGLGVLHGGQLFRGAGGLSLNLGDLVLGASFDPACDPARLIGQAGSGAIRDDAAAGRAGEALGIAMANLVTLFAPPRVLLVGATLAWGENLLRPLRAAFERAVPAAIAGVCTISVGPVDTDRMGARGAAAVALCDLYGAPWSTTGPARASR